MLVEQRQDGPKTFPFQELVGAGASSDRVVAYEKLPEAKNEVQRTEVSRCRSRAVHADQRDYWLLAQAKAVVALPKPNNAR